MSASTWYVGLPDEKISKGTQRRSSKPRNRSVPCTRTRHQALVGFASAQHMTSFSSCLLEVLTEHLCIHEAAIAFTDVSAVLGVDIALSN